jgi:hypothetical protein
MIQGGQVDLQTLMLCVQIGSAVGIGKILLWVVKVETRLTKIETTCKLKNGDCLEVPSGN